MKRRDFVGLVGGATVAWPFAALAQQSQAPRRLAFVHSGIPAAKLTETGGTYWIKTFYEELRRLGYAEGTNLVVERYSAEGSAARFAALATSVGNGRPEVIVANLNSLVRELMTANPATPVVGITTDPIATGLIKSFARPGGTVTGVSVVAGDGIDAKRLQILKEVLPAAANVDRLQAPEQSAGRMDASVKVRMLPEVTEAQLSTAFAEMAEQRVEAVLVGDSGSFLALAGLIVELAAKHRIPAFYPYRDFVEKGGLIAFAPDLGELAKRMALDVQQILGGANPGAIPFYQPTKFELIINSKTAKALGLTIPPTLLALADEVME